MRLGPTDNPHLDAFIRPRGLRAGTQNLSPLYAVEYSRACQRLAVFDFDGPVDDANRIYWSMGLRDGAWAVNAPEWCERLRSAFLFSRACQAVVVTPIPPR